jgi:hypothetical protein
MMKKIAVFSCTSANVQIQYKLAENSTHCKQQFYQNAFIKLCFEVCFIEI